MKHADFLVTAAAGTLAIGGAILGIRAHGDGAYPGVGCTFSGDGPGPLDSASGAFLILAPLLPLVVAWSSVLSMRYRVARGAATTGLVLASAQAAWALLLLLNPATGRGVPSWPPSPREIRGLLSDPPGWAQFLGAGAVWAALTWMSIREIDARRSSPPPVPAEARVRDEVRADVPVPPGGG